MTQESMRVAIPAEDAEGMSAKRSGHFGHAPYYVLVDVTDGQAGPATTIPNRTHDTQGCLGPVRVLHEQGAQALIVAGIGPRPLQAFADVGIGVWNDPHSPTVEMTIERFARGELPALAQSNCSCGSDH